MDGPAGFPVQWRLRPRAARRRPPDADGLRPRPGFGQRGRARRHGASSGVAAVVSGELERRASGAPQCRTCGKIAYANRPSARARVREEARRRGGRRIMTAYLGDCGWWHLATRRPPPRERLRIAATEEYVGRNAA